MAYGLVIPAEGGIYIGDFDENPLYKSLQKAVGGLIQVVPCRNLPEPFVMICNEEGLFQDNITVNPVASAFYGIEQHGQPIVGTVVILREEETEEGADLVSLKKGDPQKIADALERSLESL